MPVKGTKALDAVKKTTVITTYVTALPVAPAAGHLSVYVDQAVASQHREMEVGVRLKELIDRAREENYNRPTAVTTVYYVMNIDAGKDSIRTTTVSTTIVAGDIAIGINTTVLSGSRGSALIDVAFKEIIDWLGEQGRLTV